MRVLVGMVPPSQPDAVVGVHRRLPRHDAHALPQRPRLGRVEVRLVLQHVEFAVGWTFAPYDLLMLRQFRLAPYAGIGGIGVDELTDLCLARSGSDEMRQGAPIVRRHVSPFPNMLAEDRRRQDALRQAGILVIARFPGADRML